MSVVRGHIARLLVIENAGNRRKDACAPIFRGSPHRSTETAEVTTRVLYCSRYRNRAAVSGNRSGGLVRVTAHAMKWERFKT